jgi:hypothetical protein
MKRSGTTLREMRVGESLGFDCLLFLEFVHERMEEGC